MYSSIVLFLIQSASFYQHNYKFIRYKMLPKRQNAAPKCRSKDKAKVASSSPPAQPSLTNSPPPPSSSLNVSLPILFTLPNETIHEILAYFPDMNLPPSPDQWGHPFYDPAVPALGYVRQDMLRALSQTCRSFRKFFLPLLWEHFDVYTKGEGGVWWKRVSVLLEKGSLFFADEKNKVVASYVRTIRVVLTRCSTATVLPAFVKCLFSLPNLHTLYILHAHSQMTTALKDAFEGHSFPSIKKIILPSCAHNILRCCPEVIFVRCMEESGSKLIGAVMKNCKKVEVLERIQPDANMIKRIVKSIPNLKRIMMRVDPEVISFFSALKSLTAIDLLKTPMHYYPFNNRPEEFKRDPYKMPASNDLDDFPDIKAARKVLKGPEDKRRLVVVYMWDEEPWINVPLEKGVSDVGWCSRVKARAVE
ncbi:hypothetical protein M422DRAFT_71076 [Sphaerobolus stellatus SS14]|uniref:F-box domain-containing protein n=1 Tax=Sphaerobolus stellatus (strain SS14) TaxID=990650 RepID=A0A0C9UY80_SPHS4|nr:hypothetical protein M422DRAFT_71076 [Sphaerobolus stellatus SS14]